MIFMIFSDSVAIWDMNSECSKGKQVNTEWRLHTAPEEYCLAPCHADHLTSSEVVEVERPSAASMKADQAGASDGSGEVGGSRTANSGAASGDQVVVFPVRGIGREDVCAGREDGCLDTRIHRQVAGRNLLCPPVHLQGDGGGDVSLGINLAESTTAFRDEDSATHKPAQAFTV
jgi:hypothetical protein